MQHSASVCHLPQADSTPLYLAAAAGHDYIVKQLLDRGADAGAVNRVRAADRVLTAATPQIRHLWLCGCVHGWYQWTC